MHDSLPAEFAPLLGKVSHVRRVNSAEWSSSCPNCHGSPHKSGDPPDRFRMWTNANGKNKVMGWCRKCSYVWFPDGDKPPTREEFEKWRQEQLEIEHRKKREAEEAIRQLNSNRLWEYYHARLNDYAYGVLSDWGVCKENAAFWKLGFIEDYMVHGPSGSYHSPAISIPLWGYDWKVRNIKLRVLNPQSDKDRYRKYYKIGVDFGFVARPDLGKTQDCIVVEGEKKAMVVSAVRQDIQVIGMPSVTPSAQAITELDGYRRVYIILDPDARIAAQNGVSPQSRLIQLVGAERAYVVDLPRKVDDMILQNGLDIVDALRYARRKF